MSRQYILQVINLDCERDRDLIERLAALKERRLASAYIKAALREKIAKEEKEATGNED